MFKRGKTTQPFEITDHPEVIAALNAMAEDWYQRGRRDALAIAKDYREEPDGVEFGPFTADALDALIERLEV